MKVLKKAIVTVTILMIIIFSLIPPKVVKAKTTSEVGEAIAMTGRDFYHRFHDKTIYDAGNATYKLNRERAYKNIRTSGTATNLSGTSKTHFQDKYAVDCVGLVSMIMHCATGLGGDDFTLFGVPTSYGNGTGVSWETNDFESITDTNSIRPGDIICWDDHVAIYVGDGQMVDSAGAGENKSITLRSIKSYKPFSKYKLVRIKASSVNKTELRTTWYDGDGQTSDGEITDENKTYGDIEEEFTSFDDSTDYIIRDKSGAYKDKESLYYKGKQDAVIGQKITNSWFIDCLKNVTDWYIGLMTLGYKIQFVGWSTKIQNIVSDLANSIMNVEKEKEAINVEKILFNKVSFLDVNFFDFEFAGGVQIKENDVIYIIRNNIASFYYIIRSISIIVMLVVLIYVGIRMAISTVSKDKSNYKKMFFSWCIGFIIMMFIHYYMVAIIGFNESVIESMEPENGFTYIYDEVRSYAYELPASRGIPGTIMYVFLVYYMVKLLIFYFKRLLVVSILAIIAPILGISYAIEALKGKSKSISIWMKEFSFNVLIQTIHVIIYCIFMDVLFEIMKDLDILNMLSYSVLMVLILNLMLDAEKIIKRIFGIKAKTMKEVVDTVLQASGTLITAKSLLQPVYSKSKSIAIKQYNKRVDKAIDNKYKNILASTGVNSDSQLGKEMQEIIDLQKEKEKAEIKQFDSNAIAWGKNVFRGTAGLVKSVPVMYEGGPISGSLSFINAGRALNAPLGLINTKQIDKKLEEKIGKMAQKYGVNLETTITATIDNNEEDKDAKSRKGLSLQRSKLEPPPFKDGKDSNVNKKGNTFERAVRGYASWNVSMATAGTSKRVVNTLNAYYANNEIINNPQKGNLMQVLVKIQEEATKQEQRLNGAIDDLKNSGFPPVFYKPQDGESKSSVVMNLKLKEEYQRELKINIKQAFERKPSINSDEVAERLAEYSIQNNKTKLHLQDLRKVLDDIAKENDYEIGKGFNNNVKTVISEDIKNVMDGKETKFNSKFALKEIEKIIENHDWSENTTVSDIKAVVTNNIQNQVIEKLSAEELNSLLNSAISRKGTLKKKTVIPEYQEIVNTVEKISEINNDVEELTGKEIISADELIDLILEQDSTE